MLGLDPVTEPDRLRIMIGSQLQSSALRDRAAAIIFAYDHNLIDRDRTTG